MSFEKSNWTLGRRLLDGFKTVTTSKEEVAVGIITFVFFISNTDPNLAHGQMILFNVARDTHATLLWNK